MLQPKSFITAALLCLCCMTSASAAEIPAPQDIVYPGTLTLSVDLTDLDRRLFLVRESVPVKPGPLTLLYPQWLPGTHGPNGPVNLLAGLIITARGRHLPWLRDPVNMYAFHINVPADADHVDLEFQFASPQTADQGRIVATPEILGLQWNTVVLYPAGYYTSRISVKADVKLPAGWQFGTALDVASRSADPLSSRRLHSTRWSTRRCSPAGIISASISIPAPTSRCTPIWSRTIRRSSKSSLSSSRRTAN